MAREGRTIEPAGRPQAVGCGADGLGQRFDALGCAVSPAGLRKSVDPAPGLRRSSVLTRVGEPNVVFGPKPIRDRYPRIGIHAGMPCGRTTTPQCSPSGSAAFGPAGGCRPRRPAPHPRAEQTGFRSGWRPGPPGAMILDELGLELAQRDAGQRPLAFQVLESLGPPGLVKVLGCGFHRWSSRSSSLVNSRSRARSPGASRRFWRANSSSSKPRPRSSSRLATRRPADRAGQAKRPGRGAPLAPSPRRSRPVKPPEGGPI